MWKLLLLIFITAIMADTECPNIVIQKNNVIYQDKRINTDRRIDKNR